MDWANLDWANIDWDGELLKWVIFAAIGLIWLAVKLAKTGLVRAVRGAFSGMSGAGAGADNSGFARVNAAAERILKQRAGGGATRNMGDVAAEIAGRKSGGASRSMRARQGSMIPTTQSSGSRNSTARAASARVPDAGTQAVRDHAVQTSGNRTAVKADPFAAVHTSAISRRGGDGPEPVIQRRR